MHVHGHRSILTLALSSSSAQVKISSEGMQGKKVIVRLISRVGSSYDPSQRNVSTSGLPYIVLQCWFINLSIANGSTICIVFKSED